MLRADNITCITVMLDPPGPPFSECILTKKKQLNLSTCMDTNEFDQPACETPQRPKLTAQRKDKVLSPISNGVTPTRVRRFSFSFKKHFVFSDAETTGIRR